MRKLLTTLLISTSLFTTALSANELPVVLDPVINATPPGAKVSAGYVTFINDSDDTITITDAFSPDIAKVEIHLSSVQNDVAKMEKQDSISIPAGGTLKFEHGSYHIMLMGLTKPLKENTSIDIIFTTSAGDMLIEMPVRKMGHSMAGKNKTNKKKASHTIEEGESDMHEPPEENKVHDNGNEHTGSTTVVH